MGGAERQLWNVASGLDRRDFEPLVWNCGGRGPVSDLLERSGIQVFTRPLDVDTPAAVDRSVVWLRSLRVRIFYAFPTMPVWPDAFLARLSGIETVIQRRCAMYHWDPGRTHGPLEQLRNGATDIVVMASGRIAGEWLPVEKWLGSAIRMIPNGVHVPARAASWQGPPTIGNVANFRLLKGQYYLVEAFAKLAAPDARLVLAGRLVDLLAATAESFGVARRVELAGERLAPSSIYRRLSIYAHPSFTEGTSNSILEAMAHGLPVVASDAGAIPDIVDHGVTGLLVPPGDSGALAAALEELLRDETRRKRMGAAGRARAIDEFSMPRIVDLHQRMLFDCLSHQSRQASRHTRSSSRPARP